MRLWTGFHDAVLLGLIRAAWEGGDPLVLLPPSLADAPSPPGLAAARAFADYPERPVLGVYTSGTASGEPRLVLYSRRNLESSIGAIRALFDTSRIRSIFCYPQPFHVFGLALGYVHAALHDLALIAPPGRYAAHAHELRCSLTEPDLLTLGTPTHFRDLLAYRRERGLALEPSYAAVAGGAPVSRALWHELKQELAIEAPSIGYGATEASPGVTHLAPGREPLEDGEIGSPLPGVDVELEPDGLVFSGSNACLAIATDAGVELPERIRLRDRVTRRATDGGLVFQGRTDWVLNRGGAKHALEPLERAIERELGLASLCVALTDERLGQDLGVLLQGARSADDTRRVAALVSQQAGFRLDDARVRSALQLPLNASGKPDRAAAARIFDEAPVPPRA